MPAILAPLRGPRLLLPVHLTAGGTCGPSCCRTLQQLVMAGQRLTGEPGCGGTDHPKKVDGKPCSTTLVQFFVLRVLHVSTMCKSAYIVL